LYVRRSVHDTRRAPPTKVADIDGMDLTGLRNEPQLKFESILNAGEDRVSVEVVEDGTKRLQQSGYLLLRRPRRAWALKKPEWSGETPCFWIIVRVEGRSYDYGLAPRLERISPNTVEAKALDEFRGETIGRSDGMPGQSFKLVHAPVEPESLTIRVVDTELNEEEWIVVENLIGSGRTDRHVALDPGTGELRFGDGVSGQVPPADATIVAIRYRAGGGAASNVAAGLITISFNGVEGINHHPAEGGLDGQGIEGVKRKAPGRLRSLDRAVTLEDYEDLAIEKGGMARAKAIALRHPDYPGTEVTGAVTVFVAPPIQPWQMHPPLPSPAEVGRVARVLNDRRLVGAEVFVEAAKIVPVQVIATVEGRSGVPFTEVTKQAQRALNDFLNAPAREIGKAVWRDQIFAALLQARDVARVIELHLDVPDHLSDAALTERGVVLKDQAVVWGRPDHKIRLSLGPLVEA
jgi:predicted phage baseplate assembly protein